MYIPFSMVVRFFNTFTKKLEEFKPLKDKEVRMYTCGPTVYNYAHIGNYRAYIFEDQLRRYLKYRGFKVTQVMNLTDVDDKTIKNSQEQGLPLDKFTDKFKKAFFEDLKTLNIDPAEHYPEATKYIKQMIEIIQKLLDKGYAYKGDDNSVYFSISKFKDYGKLSKINIDQQKAGARVKHDEYGKENASDFALWKAYSKSDGDVVWDSPFGRGRPGWHIECSAMSSSILGDTFDIHTGGVDNIFPHHEDEIAQSECASGKKFVNYWMHCEHLLVDGKKMSKSLANFYTLRDVLDKGYKPLAIRYTLLSTHYRQQLNFTFESINAAQNSIDRLNEVISKLNSVKGEDTNEVKKLIKKAEEGFIAEMDDDLNISKGLSHIFTFVRELNGLITDKKIGENDAKKALEAFQKFDTVLGVMNFEKEDIPNDVLELAKKREAARSEKKWVEADKLRDQLKEMGYVVKDSKDGMRVEKV